MTESFCLKNPENFCINKLTLLLLILLFLIIIYIITRKTNIWEKCCSIGQNEINQESYPEHIQNNNNNKNNIINPVNDSNNNNFFDKNLNYDYDVDVVRNYDYKKIFDPLENPTRRISRYDIPPYYLKQMIDLPTRGYPDNFIQLGVLVKTGDQYKNNNNKILRLFGRHEFPGSNKYKYYALINSGTDQIKIPLNVRHNKELYDDDKVYIKELDEYYKVSLYKYDEPKYYPNLF
ncbi:Hypothetical protein KVN_LOCUS315 [uncultured virus]|nr:Hypothetical protein KVN_LOCUS315 [uncultured virus]